MANLSGAIHRVRRVRREAEASPHDFERYRPAYEAVLTAVADEAGEEAFDELEAWLLETTWQRGELPTPRSLRKRAQKLYGVHGVDIPEDSPVRE